MAGEDIEISHTTYRVSDFLSWQRAGSLDLRPPFQRLSVWTPKAQSFLIDTVLRGFPVPLIFLQEATDVETYEPIRRVVDGQQRLRTILGFVDPSCIEDHVEFSISKIHNAQLAGKKFADLSEDQRLQILNFEFSVHVLGSATTVRLLLEVFARMNSTGTRLNDQELRNGFAGAFKQAAYALSYANLERWLQWRVLNQSQISRMKDVELTSELMMFVMRGFRNKSQKSLDLIYDEFDDEFPLGGAVERRFEIVMSKLEAAYSPNLDAIYDEDFSESGFATQGWFYVLFSFVHDLMFDGTVEDKPRVRARQLSASTLRAHLAERAKTLQEDELDVELLKALRGAATDKSSRDTKLAFLATGW